MLSHVTEKLQCCQCLSGLLVSPTLQIQVQMEKSIQQVTITFCTDIQTFLYLVILNFSSDPEHFGSSLAGHAADVLLHRIIWEVVLGDCF